MWDKDDLVLANSAVRSTNAAVQDALNSACARNASEEQMLNKMDAIAGKVSTEIKRFIPSAIASIRQIKQINNGLNDNHDYGMDDWCDAMLSDLASMDRVHKKFFN
jgi:hypothetical protein